MPSTQTRGTAWLCQFHRRDRRFTFFDLVRHDDRPPTLEAVHKPEAEPLTLTERRAHLLEVREAGHEASIPAAVAAASRNLARDGGGHSN